MRRNWVCRWATVMGRVISHRVVKKTQISSATSRLVVVGGLVMRLNEALEFTSGQ